MTLLVISTVPNEDVAYNLSKRLLEKRIAACVNIIKDVNSLYWRKESIGNSIEIIPLIKTTDEKYSEVEHLIKENHPYELQK